MLKDYPSDNEGRAERGRDVMNFYAGLEGSEYTGEGEHIACLMADLMHLCKADDIDFEERLRMAHIHFEDECSEEDETDESE